MFAVDTQPVGASRPDLRPPLTLRLAALYLAGFGVYAIYVLGREATRLQSSASDAWFPLLACLTAAGLPLLLAFGLWLMDNAARISALICLGLHAISLVLWIQHTHNDTAPLPELKLLLDGAVCALLLSASARRCCRWEPESLFVISKRGR